MKLRYVLLILILVGYIFYWLGYNRQEALEACKKAGVQSDETCLRYTY